MRKLLHIFLILSAVLLWSCNNHTANEVATNTNDSIVSDTTDASAPATPLYDPSYYEEDTITDIQFEEFSLSINRLLVYDEENKLDAVQADTVIIYAELGESIEGQRLLFADSQLADIRVEQCYETSVTIMNEGPHCDLIEWKHFYSDWKQLSANSKGEFICIEYAEADSEKFPAIDIEELKQAVKSQCGDTWYKHVKHIKSPVEYPSGVGISRYFLRITATRKDNGQLVIKLIIIENPMGC